MDPEDNPQRRGGRVRAERLSEVEKSEIGRMGAHARWGAGAPRGSDAGMVRATHQGAMSLGPLNLDCYVLEDERRVIHKRGMAKALGMKSGGGNVFLRAMQRKGLGSQLSPELIDRLNKPVVFKPLTQDLAHGYEAEVLVDICKAIVLAEEADKLAPTQSDLANQARILLQAFAKVGVTALIDEATGYQEIRSPDALRLLVEQYIETEKREWSKQFPDEYYDELNRVYGSKKMTTTASGAVIQNRPQHFAKFTRSFVYYPLENGAVLEELDRLNPKVGPKNNRRERFHQHLSLGYGIEKLKRQVGEIITLMKVSDNVGQFRRLFEKRFPKSGTQGRLFDD
jgi:hypothetical protein